MQHPCLKHFEEPQFLHVSVVLQPGGIRISAKYSTLMEKTLKVMNASIALSPTEDLVLGLSPKCWSKEPMGQLLVLHDQRAAALSGWMVLLVFIFKSDRRFSVVLRSGL